MCKSQGGEKAKDVELAQQRLADLQQQELTCKQNLAKRLKTCRQRLINDRGLGRNRGLPKRQIYPCTCYFVLATLQREWTWDFEAFVVCIERSMIMLS